ncbi:MAG: pseudouridine synthase, partial [Cellvibrionaceae bacterium]|nr:pseudouridine synthase [Cellvibrionaceae bacterium]
MTNEHFEPIFNAAEATQVVFQQPASEPIELHIPIDPSSQETLALAVLQQASSLSRAQLKDAMSKGAVWAQKGKRTAPLRRHKQSCQGIEQLHLYYNAKVLAEQPGALKKLHGEKDFSVWLKPRGMRSHGSRWGDHCSVLRQGELQLERSCYIVHRLDSAASGLILLAHN